MTEGEMKWFSNEDEWIDYVTIYMRNAQRNDSMFVVTITDNRNEVIAKWNRDGSGQVWEKRSKERLENEAP